MKKLNFGKALGAILMSAFLVTGFHACTKDSGGLNLSGTANIMVVNGAEGTLPQDFYSDTTRSASAVAYAQNTSYTTTSAGNHQGQFKTTGTTTVTATANVTFESGKYYTVYLGGSGSSSSVVTTTDDMTAPAAGKARVRFVHLSSAAAASVDLAVTGGTKVVSGLAYQTASAYNDVDANTSFTLYAAGSATAVLTIPSTFQAGKIYTIYISGATTATLSSHVIAQN